MAEASAPEKLGFTQGPDPKLYRRRVRIARLIVIATFVTVWQGSVASGLVDEGRPDRYCPACGARAAVGALTEKRA
jgi:hypothetical protein